MTRYHCETCRDTGRVSNGCDPFNPGYEDGPCPEPDCPEGEAEREGAWAAREREQNQRVVSAYRDMLAAEMRAVR